jgi:hypothetical protein
MSPAALGATTVISVPSRSLRSRRLRSNVVSWLLLLGASVVGAQQPNRGFDEEALLRLLRSAMPRPRIVKFVQEACFDGPLDVEQQVRLRRAGAEASLLAALRTAQCKRTSPVRPRLQPDSLVLRVGESGRVEVEGQPPGNMIVWRVADSLVVSVSGGMVKALRGGETMLYASIVGQDLSMPVKVRSPPPGRAPTVLMVRSDRTGETIRIDGTVAGFGSVQIPVAPGRFVRIAVGNLEDRRDTVVQPVPERTTVLQLSTTERRRGLMPDRSQLFIELTPLLRQVPTAIGNFPVEPRRVGVLPTVGGSLLLGAGAYLASSSFCTGLATAPAPHGGFIGSKYFRPGDVSATVRTGCLGTSVGSGLVLGGLVGELVRRGVKRGRMQRHERDRARYVAMETERVAVERHNADLIDSVYIERAMRASQVEFERRWNVTVMPRVP